MNEWELLQEVKDGPPFSTYVEIDGPTLAITEMPYVAGGDIRVFIYERAPTGEGLYEKVITHSLEVPIEGDYLAGGTTSSIRLVEHTLAVGLAPQGCMYGGSESPEPEGGCGSGEVHLFGRDVGGEKAWGKAQVLVPAQPLDRPTFGQAVDLSSDGRFVLVAAGPLDGTWERAALYVYER